MNQPLTAKSDPTNPPLDWIVAAAIAAEGGTIAEAFGPSRDRHASRSRQAAMWLAFKVTPHSLQAIGEAIGRHHTTVIYGIRAYERRIQKDPKTKALSERLLTRFLSESQQTEGEQS